MRAVLVQFDLIGFSSSLCPFSFEFASAWCMSCDGIDINMSGKRCGKAPVLLLCWLFFAQCGELRPCL